MLFCVYIPEVRGTVQSDSYSQTDGDMRMVLSRIPHRVDRLTVTLIPEHDEHIPLHVPSTFNTSDRMYGWKRAGRWDYMIVPTRISSNEVKVDLFVNPARGGKLHAKQLQKVVEEFVQAKLASEWRGLRLAEVGRPSSVVPPKQYYIRGTIEEMLGTSFEG